MTPEQIKQWAQEAGFHNFYWTQDYHIGIVQRFAALVAAHEREQCALVCDEISVQAMAMWKATYHPVEQGREMGADHCADDIRARGEQT